MRLYSRTGAVAIEDPAAGQRYEPGPDGGFDLPEDFALRQHAFHVGGKPLWETDIERQHRLMAEELERRKDPATLLEVVEKIMQASQATPAPTPAKAPRARKPPSAAE